MTVDPTPANEPASALALHNPQRVAALQQTRLLDSDAEAAFDRLTRLAATIIGAPVSLVSLVDVDRQFFKSAYGLDERGITIRSTPLSYSFCQHTLANDQPLVVEDVRVHPLVRDNRSIDAFGIVAYAGVPLITDDGQALGAFCVMDMHPRAWTTREIDILRELAALVMTEINLRAATQRAEQRAHEAEQQRAQKETILESITDAFFTLDQAWRVVYLNAEAARMVRRDQAQMLGQVLWDVLPGARQTAVHDAMYEAVATQRTSAFEEFFPTADLWLSGRIYPTPDGLSVFFQDTTARHAADLTLQINEERLRLATDGANFGTWDWDMTTGTVTWSSQVEAMLGMEHGSFGGTFEDVVTRIYSEDRAASLAAMRRAVEHGEHYRVDLRMLAADGAPRWVHSEGRVLLDHGKPVRMVGVIVDIDERRTIENALRASEERLHRVVETIADGILMVDPDERIMFANGAAATILGVAQDTLNAQPVSSIMQHVTLPDGSPISADDLPFVQVLRSGRALRNVVLLLTKPDTSRITLAVNAAPLQGDGIKGVVLTFSDITEYARAEGAQQVLVQAGDVLSNTLNYDEVVARIAQIGVPDFADWCAAYTYENGHILPPRVVHADPAKREAARALEALHPPQASGTHPVAQVISSGVPLLIRDVARDIPTPQDPQFAAITRELGFRSLLCVPLLARGRTLGALLFVSARVDWPFTAANMPVAEELGRRAALALDNARLYREAQEAVQSRDDLFSTVTHDLKNPLTTITGYVDVLQRRIKRMEISDADRITDGLLRIRQAGEKMTRQLNDLLDTAVIRSGGQLDLQRDYVNIVDLLRQICADEQQITMRHEIRFASEETELIGQFDTRRLERVFNNLVSNAVKYSPAGGTIRVTLEHQREDAHDWAVLTVVDSGIGIPTADLSHIFERFRRGSNVGAIKGNGIGLATVASIVHQHGGTTHVTSTEGTGTTFTVRLPLTAYLQEERAA